ncbi:MAG TPA: amylo-alpha-1,6-glucosidase [Steroidobacteraceae bacterium]
MSAESLALAGSEYYILAHEVPVPERTHVLKRDDALGIFNEFGDIAAGARNEEGLFYEGTRFLSQFALRLVGARPLLLSSAVRRDDLLLSVDLTNPDIDLGSGKILPRGSLHIYRTKILWEGTCHERIHVRNFTLTPLDIALSLEFSSDFADIFEIRGQQRPRRGRTAEPLVGADFAELAYVGLDGVVRRTRVECQPPPDSVTGTELRLRVQLESHSEQIFEITVSCQTETPRQQAMSYDAAVALAERSLREGERLRGAVATPHERLASWIERSTADLNMLLVKTPAGIYPAAGVPWFDTTFGRDGIITALQCLWLSPNIAQGVLAFLAETQATRVDPENDAEPGKILHEARYGEMAALGEVPFGRYYGSIDATPLFVMLAGAYWRRTGDLPFINGVWNNIVAALDWLDKHGDLDGDGFIEYRRRSPRGLVQQGWKDSQDAVFHEDGTLAEGPIALCEAQAYAYAARIAGSELADALGHDTLAHRLREKAATLRGGFETHFWCEEMGLYALALDGKKQACRVRTSNAGHCLFTGIVPEGRIGTITKSLGDETFFTGWGVRTLADREVRYNPMAYHNGSIWPHDNALLAFGLAGSPDKTLALRIFTAQLEASAYFDSGRLPELFCGFRRRDGKAPTSYPVACSPQAWSAGAVFMLLQACLGLSIDAALGQITFRYPQLPPNIERLSIRGLEVGKASVDLTLQGGPGAFGVTVDRRVGKLSVSVLA